MLLCDWLQMMCARINEDGCIVLISFISEDEMCICSSVSNSEMSNDDWHQSDDFTDLCNNFHNQFARYPKKQLKNAKGKHEPIMNELKVRFRSP